MRPWAVICLLSVACDPKEDPPTGELPDADLCTLAVMAWASEASETGPWTSRSACRGR